MVLFLLYFLFLHVLIFYITLYIYYIYLIQFNLANAHSVCLFSVKTCPLYSIQSSPLIKYPVSLGNSHYRSEYKMSFYFCKSVVFFRDSVGLSVMSHHDQLYITVFNYKTIEIDAISTFSLIYLHVCVCSSVQARKAEQKFDFSEALQKEN